MEWRGSWSREEDGVERKMKKIRIRKGSGIFGNKGISFCHEG